MNLTNQPTPVPYPGKILQPDVPQQAGCSISYGKNNILCPKPQGPNQLQLIEPTLEGIERAGKYQSFPEGLDINGDNGTISVDTSDAGLKYLVVHTSPSGKSCRTTVLVSGITYESNIFEGDSTMLSPIFNASREDKAAGIFDQPKRLGRFDLKPASDFGLAINPHSGVIDLAQTVKNLRLLNVGLQDGFSRLFNITYHVKNVTGVIPVVIYYYAKSKDHVPSELIKLIEFKRTLQDYDGGFEIKSFQMMKTMARHAMTASDSVGKVHPTPSVVIL